MTRAEREKLKETRQIIRVLRHITPALEAAEKLKDKKLAGRVRAAHTMVCRYADTLLGENDEQEGGR